jgi:HPt (histidine-containing phosphotransfer) domain-containing protein
MEGEHHRHHHVNLSLASSSSTGAFMPKNIQRARAHSRTCASSDTSCSAAHHGDEQTMVEELRVLVNRQAARIDQLERGLLATQWRVSGYEAFNLRGKHTDNCVRIQVGV